MQIKKLKKKLFYADFYAKTFYAKKKKLIEKDPDAGKDWRKKEKRATED